MINKKYNGSATKKIVSKWPLVEDLLYIIKEKNQEGSHLYIATLTKLFKIYLL
jgi:hypothetical protein